MTAAVLETSAEGAPLGIYTKRLAILEARATRYALQSIARWSLKSYIGPQKAKAHRMRVIKCLRTPIAPSVSVVQRGGEGGVSSYRGTCLCGSVWVCPVCSAKITEARREDLDEATETWKGRGGHLGLLSLTFPHCAHDELSQILPRFTKALQRFSMSRQFRRIWGPAVGLVHRVRATEFTVGPNGWHPHVHILLFLDKPLDSDGGSSSGSLIKAWQSACVRSGLRSPSEVYGVDLRDGSYAADYVGKWGISHELAKANVKRGRGDNRTPWDLLRSVLESGNITDALPFVHYALATKGTRQLCWSKGARADLGLAEEVSDEDLMTDNIDVSDVLLATLSHEVYRKLWRIPGAASKLLEMSENKGAAGVREYLSYLQLG